MLELHCQIEIDKKIILPKKLKFVSFRVKLLKHLPQFFPDETFYQKACRKNNNIYLTISKPIPKTSLSITASSVRDKDKGECEYRIM